MTDQRHKRNYGRGYGWGDAQSDLAHGVHPEVVAARIGEPIAYLLETADAQRWPITWNGRAPLLRRHVELLKRMKGKTP